MKKLVWSRTELTGGKRYTGKLPQPPSVTGPYQAIPMAPDIGDMMSKGKPPAPLSYYADIAVLAYPETENARPRAPEMLAGDGERVDGSALFDADPETALAVRGAVTLDYGAP